jgi:glycosyltransferase involved in cell wall biosynthesis
MNNKYILITAAHNEEVTIENCIKSVISQTIKPKLWIIVSDRSTDKTNDIIQKYSPKNNYIKFVDFNKNSQRDMGARINAINEGFKYVEDENYDYIGILDADITFENDYYENIIKEFEKNPRLGLAGGIRVDYFDNKYHTISHREDHVCGAVQLFTNECYADFGGYIPMPKGGTDGYAIVMVRMKGWEVKSFPEIKIIHHRRTGSVNHNVFQYNFNRGYIDYTLGYHPLYALIVSMARMKKKPYMIGGLVKFCGYLFCLVKKIDRPVSEEFVRYQYKEQIKRLKSIYKIRMVQNS